MPRKRPVARELGENRVPELPETDVARSPRGRPRRAVTQEQGNHSAPYVLIAFPKSIETVCRNTFISQIHWHCLTIVQSNYSYTRSEILTLFFHNLRSAGPIALLGGLETNPLTLVGHFFSVALFGVGRLMVPLPTPGRIIKGLQLLKGAVTIITPIVWGEGLVRMFVPSQLRERWGWI